MTGAIEFLRKAKAICDSRSEHCHINGICPVYELCVKTVEGIDEADLVRKVMDYQIKGDANAD